MSQVALVLLAGGLSAASTGWIFLFALSAAIGGGGAAISTPASSHLLGRYSPPSYAPLVFSLKQTAVPAGLLMAGLLGPALTQSVGWSTTLNIAAAGCVLFAFMLQRLRPEFDADRVPSRQFRFSDFRTTFTSVLATTDLRNPWHASRSTDSRPFSPPISSSTFSSSAMIWRLLAWYSRSPCSWPCRAAYCGAGSAAPPSHREA
ncbi:MFS transporter [Roseomonas hellenica]|uniref:MFS transporter n=1 Tax=Plastoroseomonas hellenica TaxID=2687306 RepID=A0ABS5EWZ5_9PROT|nr:MFS transporter [Plastoroseomonas hellenica]